MEQYFGTKELYWAALKTTYPIEIGGRHFDPYETIAEFSRLQVSSLDEEIRHKAAQGGFENDKRVFWDTTKEINFNFSQGIFTTSQLALIDNSTFYIKDKSSYLIPKTEELETDENGKIELKFIPSCDLFVYDKKTGEKIANSQFSIDKTILTFKTPYQELIIRYYFNYTDKSTLFKIGQRMIPGFLMLEGKMRLKEDSNGQNVTGFLVIPKLKLMSDLSMRFGREATPTVADFSATGYPVGEKGRRSVCELSILSEDIDDEAYAINEQH